VLYAPAMHTEMWEHPATQASVSLLLQPRGHRARARGSAGSDRSGQRWPAGSRNRPRSSRSRPGCSPGAAPPASCRGAAAHRLTLLRPDLTAPDACGGCRAGEHREEIDPVRFIGNWSTGTQGVTALARTAVARGAEVIVVAANVALPESGRGQRSSPGVDLIGAGAMRGRRSTFARRGPGG